MPARSAPSSGAARSARSSSIRARTFTRASARRSGARRRPSRSAASRRSPSSASTIPDGEALIADVQRGPVRASIETWLREGWMRCLLPVVEIRGHEDPDEFLLVHGHYDSWYEGIGDNATGDAALLELARVLWGLRDRLKRTRPHRLVARPLDRPLRRIDLVRRHLRRRDRRALHRAARHRLARLRRRHRLRRSDVDGGGRRAVPHVDPRRARPALAAGAAAARRRLLVQPDRPDRPLHAALEHPDRGAQAPRLLRGRRLRRQHRLAHAGRPDAGRRSRDPAPRSVRLPHDDRAHPERAAAPVRLRGGDRRNAGRRSPAIRTPPPGTIDLHAAPRRPDALGRRPAPMARAKPRPASR